MFARRRCVVCGRHVRRSDFRARRVLVRDDHAYWQGFGFGVGVAHHRCLVFTDAGLERLIRQGK